MEEHNLIVEGYAFANEEDARLAREELKKVHFFDTKMDYSNTENVLMLFQKILEERVFRTQIGMDYLHKLQSLLRETSDAPACGNARKTTGTYVSAFFPDRKRCDGNPGDYFVYHYLEKR